MAFFRFQMKSIIASVSFHHTPCQSSPLHYLIVNRILRLVVLSKPNPIYTQDTKGLAVAKLLRWSVAMKQAVNHHMRYAPVM